jgi:hypothetical protein
MIVTFIYCNRPADSLRVQVRCRNLADVINRSGQHRANLLDMKSFVENTSRAQRLCGESDLLVIYRYLYDSILSIVQYWQARDKKVIVDFDQAFDLLSPDSPDALFWQKGHRMDGCFDSPARISPPPLEQFKWGLAILDAATVNSYRLADDWAQFTKIYTLPDYLNTDQYPALNQPLEGEIRLGLGYRARASAAASSGLMPAIERVCRQYPQVKFVEFTQPCAGLDEWVSHLSTLDIGLMPAHDPYDMRLGSYDLLEFMISKISWLASANAQFQPFSAYGDLVKNTAQDWEAALLDAVDHLEARREEAGGSAFLFALSQNLASNLAAILKVYETILHQ